MDNAASLAIIHSNSHVSELPMINIYIISLGTMSLWCITYPSTISLWLPVLQTAKQRPDTMQLLLKLQPMFQWELNAEYPSVKLIY